jgi:glutamine synthetase
MASASPTFKIVAEYVWIDSDLNLRSKTKIIEKLEYHTSINDFPEWNFDGSSTGQSKTKNSDLILKPVDYIKNPLINKKYINQNCGYYLVLCKVIEHESNNYNELKKLFHKTIGDEPWFGIEQEYMLLDYEGQPLDQYLINKEFEYKDNQHYCSVGTGKSMGREIVMEHMHACIEAGIKICGVNSEVTPSQWEFQIGPLYALEVCNQLWLARYILIQIAESHNVTVTFHPKPFTHLNGSGAHTNFSTKAMRKEGGINEIYKAIDKLSKNHKTHIEVYGNYNELRLTGTNETANINTFSYGSCDRSSSIRIPINVMEDKKGYLEDRRPASNMDPYLVVGRILKTVILEEFE